MEMRGLEIETICLTEMLKEINIEGSTLFCVLIRRRELRLEKEVLNPIHKLVCVAEGAFNRRKDGLNSTLLLFYLFDFVVQLT